MNATHDRLDEAIDQVAKRLTQMADDDAIATQIINSLPERAPRHWAPRLAITTGLVIGALLIVLRMFDDRSTDVLRTEDASAPLVEFRAGIERTADELPHIARRTFVARSQNDRRTIDAPDHEYSLRAIDSPEALSVSVVASESLAVDEALSLPPLTIADLPLTTETPSPR